ncbi:universal stress protein [Piscinibacter gummiphilus]|uniref:Universal stress protein n=1 Tax=Piscinibacter gummiphilus TaxID=946333 RepID=A0ABZ0CM22_9BURK|nr:universal stress protein [Piscinibacter gummiphilus]WOB06025.1 universal stress protein [Piscinibacter gummiphilus]
MRNLLVHLDASPACAVRVRVARQLAARHGARVSVLFAVTVGSADLPSSFSANVLADAARLADIDGRHRARAAVEKMVSLGGPEVDWSETTTASPLAALTRRALFADLLVLGKRAHHGPRADQLPANFAETVVVHSGKPALVVPDELSTGEPGRRIVIAWKPSRESGRAVAAALPLLQDADEVHVLMWDEPHDTRTHPESPLSLDTWLRAHGVAAQLHTLGRAPSRIGEAILAQTQALRGDLLVMGCYGHSRARELVLGGASRSVLKQVPLPVLLAH